MIARPHLGLGEIRLGSTRAEVLSLLGEPDRREKFAFLADETTEYFEYDALELELGFSTDDGDRLGVIRCGSDQTSLDERPVIGLSAAEFHQLHPGFEEDDDEEFSKGHQDYSHPEKEITVSISRQGVISLSLFPAWNEDDTPKWPE
jgi:hypothetical protein